MTIVVKCRELTNFPLVLSQTASSAPRSAVVLRAGPDGEWEDRSRARRGEEKPEFKHFLPLPKPKHLVYIKPTVAVVADVASRSSVGVKMTAGGNQLERYVVEYFARSVSTRGGCMAHASLPEYITAHLAHGRCANIIIGGYASTSYVHRLNASLH